MSRKVKAIALVVLTSLSFAAFASAAGDTFSGPSEDDGETVKIKVKENGEGHVSKVVSFTTKQGECGSTTVEPKKPKRLNDEGMFTLKEKSGGLVVFKVTGGVVTTGIIQGEYEQIACDGDTDTFVAYDEE